MASMAKNNLLTAVKKEVKPITPVPVVAQPVTPDYSQFINQITEAQKAKTIADYQNAYQKSLGTLTEQESKIAPAYAQDRSNLQTTNVMEAKRLENLLAQQGLASAGAGETMSGAGSQRNIAQSIGFQGAMSANQLAEKQALEAVAKQKAQLGTDLNYNIASANSAADIQALQAQLQARQQADELARTEALRLETKAESATAAEKQAFLDTISRFSKDYSAAINTVKNDGDTSNDWQIPYLEAMRQEKITTQNLDPLTGKPLAVDNTQAILDMAMWKWNAGMPLTQQEMQAIGATTSTKPKTLTGSGSSSGSKTTVTQDRNYQLDRWEILGVADQAIADAWGVPVGTPVSSKPVETPETNTSAYENYIETYLVNEDADGNQSLNRQGTAKYIYDLMSKGLYAEADRLMTIYGISEQEVDTIERVLGNRR